MVEDEIFKEYKEYILQNSIFADTLKVFPNTPKSLADFPTIIMRQMNESDYIQGKTTDRLEYVSRIYYRVSIYAKPTIIDETKYQPKQIINELRE